MANANLRDRPIEDFVKDIQGATPLESTNQIRAIAALAARCTVELSSSIATLTDMVFTAKRQMVERMDALTVELVQLRHELDRSSTESAKHTAALVSWTKVLVIVTGIYTLITGGLLLATILKPR